MIILDEADSMTGSAQQALRRTMEIFSNTTRFALACNISSKIIEPIQSRCAILRYSRLSDQQILYRLTHVAEKEGVPCSEDGLEAIIFTAEGDMRNALNNLQATFAGFKHVNRENGKKNTNQIKKKRKKVVCFFLSIPFSIPYIYILATALMNTLRSIFYFYFFHSFIC